MKKRLPIQIVAVIAAITLTGLISGCVLFQGKTPVTIAAQGEAITIPSVNLAMMEWAEYVKQGHATQAQVDQVKSTYEQYYQSQLVASNAFVAYFKAAADSTNDPMVALNTLLLTASVSKTNLLALISSIQKGK